MTVVLTVLAVALFVLGCVTLLIGLGMILTREYLDALRSLTRESSHLGAKAAQDAAFLPLLEGASRLVDSVTRMVQTAVGVGGFLCLLGAGLCYLAYWMLIRSR
jgi:hypothetical protein